MLPNLFIVGAMKCGTTTVFNMLAGATGVNTCISKEPNHFCTDLYGLPDYVETGRRHKSQIPSWVRGRDEYLALFPHRDARWVCEGSVSYLYSTTAAEQIREFNPDARIVISLRNPIARAYSEYLMCREIGITSSSFSRAIRDDYERMRTGDRRIYERYVRSGMYAQQVKRYLQAFPRDQVFIDILDRPNAGADHMRERLAAFLGVDIPPIRKRANVARAANMPGINHLLFKSGAKTFASHRLPAAAKSLLKRLYYSDRVVRRIGDEDRLFLEDVFRQDISELSALIEEDLSFWLPD